MNVKYVADQLAPFFKSNGFIRKGNQFYKFKQCCIVNIVFEHGFSIMPGFYIYPLYFPFNIKYIEYGSRLEYYRRNTLKFKNYSYTDPDVYTRIYSKPPTNGDKWIISVKDFFEYQVFPFLSKIDSVQSIKKFLDLPWYVIREYWSNMSLPSYYKLRAYTHFVLGKYKEMKKDIENGVRVIDSFRVAEHIAGEWKEMLEILNTKMNLSEAEKEEWMNDIACSTLQICLGKNWETLIKNRLTLPLDFKSC